VDGDGPGAHATAAAAAAVCIVAEGKRWCVLFRAVLGWSPEEDSRWVESWNSLRGYGVIAPLLPLFLSFICPIFLCPIFSLGGIIAKISHRFFSSRNVVSNFSGVWLFAA
jgi:hypothetical protein